MRKILPVLLLITISWAGWAQVLPSINLDRKHEKGYLDSLKRVSLTALSGYKKAPQGDTTVLGVLYQLANIYKQKGRLYQDSCLYYSERLYTAAAGNSRYQVSSLMLREFCYKTYQQDYTKALQMNRLALNLCQEGTDCPTLWQIKMNVGQIYLLMKDYADALRYLQESLALLKTTRAINEHNRKLFLAVLHASLGDVFAKTNQVLAALHEYEESLRIVRLTGVRLNIAYANERLGDFFNYRGRPLPAIPYYREALKIWEKLNHSEGIAVVRADLSACYQQLGQDSLAIVYAEQALAMGRQRGNAKIQETAYKVLYKAHKTVHNPSGSLWAYEKFVEISDSLNQLSRLDEVAMLEKKYEIERIRTEAERQRILQQARLLTLEQRAEVELLRTESEKRRLQEQARLDRLRRRLETARLKAQAERKQMEQETKILWLKHDLENDTLIRRILLVGLGLVIGFLLMLYRKNRQIDRQKKEIEALNGGLEDKVALRTAELQRANEELICKNREIQEALLRGQTLERKRVAAELHDNLGGLLSAIKFCMEGIRPRNLAPRENQIYNDVIMMLRQAYGEVRNLSHNLQPEELEQQGLAGALSRLVEKLNFSQKTQFTLHMEDFKGTDKHIDFVLYSVCLELVNNILRHAEASEALIELQQFDDKIILLVSDNGRGIAIDQQKGMGLKNIRSRVEQVGGELSVKTVEGQGTAFRINFPLVIPNEFVTKQVI